MERGADGEFDRSLRSTSFCHSYRTTDGTGVSGDNDLSPPVQIGGRDDLALSCVSTHLEHFIRRKVKDGGHRSNIYWHCLLHQSSTLAHDTQRIGQGQCTGSHQ